MYCLDDETHDETYAAKANALLLILLPFNVKCDFLSAQVLCQHCIAGMVPTFFFLNYLSIVAKSFNVNFDRHGGWVNKSTLVL